MLTIGGLVLLLVCVFGSYIFAGGHLEPLMEAMPFELLTIGGAAIGTFVMSNSMHYGKHTLAGFKKILKGATFAKSHSIELLGLLFLFIRLASTKGAMALEPQISVETGRKMAPNQHMPSFQEVEEAVQSVQLA